MSKNKKIKTLESLLAEINISSENISAAYDAIESGTNLTVVNGLVEIDEDIEAQIRSILEGAPEAKSQLQLHSSSNGMNNSIGASGNKRPVEQEVSSEDTAEATTTAMMAGIVERLRKQINGAKKAEEELFGLVASYLETGGVYPPGLSPFREKVVSDLAHLLLDEEMRVTKFRGHLPVRIRIHGADVALEPFIKASDWQLNAGGSSLVPCMDSLLIEAQVTSVS